MTLIIGVKSKDGVILGSDSKGINFFIVRKGKCVRFPVHCFVSKDHWCHEFKLGVDGK